MELIIKKINQFQGLFAAIVALLAAIGVDKAGLSLRNPTEWGIWEPIFIISIVLIVVISVVRQIYISASWLRDPNALRLDPNEPRLLLGRTDDIARIVGALSRRLVFLVGESGSGKTALLKAGVLTAPVVIREFVPVYIDLTDQDWGDGLLVLIRNQFHSALPDAERQQFAASDSTSIEDIMAAFDLYRQKLGRRPLVIFDQFDDYAAHHMDYLRDLEIGDWHNANVVAANNSALDFICKGLMQHGFAVVFASRREDQDALESVRMLPNPSILRLDRPPAGSAGPIIDAVTTAQAAGHVVIENLDATWPALKRRMAADIERTGQVLPQQLKLVLQGLRSLPRLTVGAYERVGRVDGLEAASVRNALAAASRSSTLSVTVILDQILVPLVDSERSPPGKARPRTIAQLADPDLSSTSVAEVLATLSDREIVHCVGHPSNEAAPWQLDHDYLARPILRLKAEKERWAILLAERTSAFQDAGLNPLRRWRNLLSIWQQISILAARLHGKLYYGTASSLALVSLFASIISIVTPLTAVSAMVWAAWQYNEAARIEASLGGIQQELTGPAQLTRDQRGGYSRFIQW